MPEIVALSCPVCAAPLQSQDADRCDFCGSIVFIKSNLPRLNKINLNTSVIHEHIATFRKRVRADQYDEEAHYGLGVAYYNLGLSDAAIEELATAANLMPENPDIRIQLATVLFESDDPALKARAKQQFNAILTLDPTHDESLRMMALLLLEEGDIQGARRYADKRIANDPALQHELLGHLATNELIDSNLENAKGILERLPENAVRTSLIRFIHRFNTPLHLVSLEDVKKPGGCVTWGGGLFLLFWLLGMFGDESSMTAGGFMIWGTLVAGFAAWIWRKVKTYATFKKDSEYFIASPSTIESVPTADLHRMAEGLVRFQLGEVTTPEHKAELMAMQKQRK